MLKLIKNWYKKLAVLLLVLLVALVASTPTGVSITLGGVLSLEANVALAVNNPPIETSPTGTVRYSGITVVEETSWGYLYTLENGDIIEVGDSTTTDFKAHIKTIRWNGVADFSLWRDGGTLTPTLNGTTVSFDFDDNIHIDIYPAPPSSRLPEGGIEYDITLNSKLAQNKIDFSIDWNNITWTKLLPLDEEYDQAASEEKWGIELAPFTITATSITSDVTSQVLLTREEYEVNSYIGMATQNYHKSSGDLGGGVTYSTVSRSYLHIHRGLMTDDLGDTAWVEDINLNESKKEITFTLPKTWLRNAEYPISQVVGLDPAYTEDMDFWVTDTYGDSDNTWSDYDLFTEKGVPKGAVAEIILTNQEPGTENEMGVRTDSSGLARYVDLHEAEGGGVTTARMFVLVDASTGLIEGYHSDVSDDDSFYLVGYWENVGFTEANTRCSPGDDGLWEEFQLADSGAANRVGHYVLGTYGVEVDWMVGIRNTASELERKILMHEPEGGGYNWISMLAKADADYKVDIYVGSTTWSQVYLSGYFGEELDFVELFQPITHVGDSSWDASDLTAYLDEDGRVCDFLLTHNVLNDPQTLGVRDGDEGAVNRYFQEHEAEDDGGSTGEVAGFGISAKSNASGVVNLYSSTASEVFYLMGYFKPAAVGVEPAAEVVPTTWEAGILEVNATANTAINFFRVTNTGSGDIDIEIKGIDAAGGDDTWDLADDGSPGENIFGLYAGLDDVDDLFDIIIKEDAAYNTLVAGLAEEATQDWGIKLYMPTSVPGYDGQEMTIIVTLIVSSS